MHFGCFWTFVFIRLYCVVLILTLETQKIHQRSWWYYACVCMCVHVWLCICVCFSAQLQPFRHCSNIPSCLRSSILYAMADVLAWHTLSMARKNLPSPNFNIFMFWSTDGFIMKPTRIHWCCSFLVWYIQKCVTQQVMEAHVTCRTKITQLEINKMVLENHSVQRGQIA